MPHFTAHTSDALCNPLEPINLMYAQEIGRIEAEPNGDAATGPADRVRQELSSVERAGCEGKYGLRCFFLNRRSWIGYRRN